MILSFHGADNKTGTTQLSQTTAFMWAGLNKDKKVLVVSLNKKRSSQFISESCLSIETYRNRDSDSVFEKYNVFSPSMIDGIIKDLKSYHDETLRSEMKDNKEEMHALVFRYFHCG